MGGRILFCAAIAIFASAAVASAEPTHVTVRVISKGAKFIGSSMGGVQVTIKDADTGEVLAEGVTSGATGDTARIMKDRRSSSTVLFTEGAAEFRVTLDLEEPRRVEVTAYGPLSPKKAANRVSATQWLVPGKHVARGDAWLLEMPGLVVDVAAPPADVLPAPQRIVLSANVMMMCGCPLGPDTEWNIADFEVRAVIARDGKRVTEIPLEYAGKHSRFGTEYVAEQPGSYEATVYAYQRENGNTGLDRVRWVIGK